jgi:hypothetical protein
MLRTSALRPRTLAFSTLDDRHRHGRPGWTLIPAPCLERTDEQQPAKARSIMRSVETGARHYFPRWWDTRRGAKSKVSVQQVQVEGTVRYAAEFVRSKGTQHASVRPSKRWVRRYRTARQAFGSTVWQGRRCGRLPLSSTWRLQRLLG